MTELSDRDNGDDLVKTLGEVVLNAGKGEVTAVVVLFEMLRPLLLSKV